MIGDCLKANNVTMVSNKVIVSPKVPSKPGKFSMCVSKNINNLVNHVKYKNYLIVYITIRRFIMHLDVLFRF